ncbi:unnamed protein product (mitochondrion) [Plasmodiophora brassicae]|uniref:Uncharacterized protein n=1 Tax=Plasmodiophora brassicae TaxID=37360 RepID=A0A3P3Y296_PLABS|nr:unnamed protein product [Plasmodiophora brassicae]
MLTWKARFRRAMSNDSEQNWAVFQYTLFATGWLIAQPPLRPSTKPTSGVVGTLLLAQYPGSCTGDGRRH